MRLQVIRRRPQTVFDERIGFFDAVTALAQNGQFQKCIGNFLGDPQHSLKAFHGLVRPKNHPVTLAGQVQDVGLLSAKLH